MYEFKLLKLVYRIFIGQSEQLHHSLSNERSEKKRVLELGSVHKIYNHLEATSPLCLN